ncbi:TolB family protein [candidate division KSB1 bacterium]
MKNNIFMAVFLLFFLSVSSVAQDFPVLKGKYLGQDPPGMTPELFAPGIISTEKDEINSIFSPNGKEFFFARDTYKNISKAGKDYTIMYMTEGESGWTKSRAAPFTGEYMCADMFFSPDGDRLFFCTDRPPDNSNPRKDDSDIWYVERTESGWSNPRNLGSSINSIYGDWYPVMAQDRTFYFSSRRDNGKGGSDLYYSKYENGKYYEAELLSDDINTEYNEGDSYIAKDKSYIIITSTDRPDSHGSGDFYIAFRRSDGSWTEAVNMGTVVNSNSLEYCPVISPDEKYFFFTSRRRGNDDIYWVDAKIIDKLKPKEIK